MKWFVSALVASLVIFLGISVCFAYTSFDELERQSEMYEQRALEYKEIMEKYKSYLDAVNSENYEEWEKARKNLSLPAEDQLSGASSELEYVQNQYEFNYIMFVANEAKVRTIREKKQIYFLKTICHQSTAYDHIENEFPVFPKTESYWFLSANTDPEQILKEIEENPAQYEGTVILVTGKIIEKDLPRLIIKTASGAEYSVRVIIGEGDNIENSLSAIGESINAFLTVLSPNSDPMLALISREENIDRFVKNRYEYFIQNGL